MSRFSIILPVYNGGMFIKEAVESILNQTYSDFNLIILDNASNDGTYEWLSGLKDDRIIIHRSETKLTIEENWSRILTTPKNEFITLIGHDDLLLPHYLSEMNELINRFPDATLYQTHFSYINEKGAFKRSCLPMAPIQSADEFLACQMLRTIDSTGTGYMMRSTDYNALGGIPANYKNLIFADYALWLSLMLKGYKVTSTKECFKYRIHDSVSRLTNGEQYQDAFMTYFSFILSLGSQYPAIQKVIDEHGLEMLNYYCKALSHRILKTNINARKIKVKDFVANCKILSRSIHKEHLFKPLRNPSILAAIFFDTGNFTRLMFGMYKKITAGT